MSEIPTTLQRIMRKRDELIKEVVALGNRVAGIDLAIRLINAGSPTHISKETEK